MKIYLLIFIIIMLFSCSANTTKPSAANNTDNINIKNKKAKEAESETTYKYQQEDLIIYTDENLDILKKELKTFLEKPINQLEDYTTECTNDFAISQSSNNSIGFSISMVNFTASDHIREEGYEEIAWTSDYLKQKEEYDKLKIEDSGVNNHGDIWGMENGYTVKNINNLKIEVRDEFNAQPPAVIFKEYVLYTNHRKIFFEISFTKFDKTLFKDLDIAEIQSFSDLTDEGKKIVDHVLNQFETFVGLVAKYIVDFDR